MLMDIATIDLHISILVTCLCDPEAVPQIPISIDTLSRPSVKDLLKDFISLSPSSEEEDSVEIRFNRIQKSHGLGGGVSVCASGPESLTREIQNALTRLGLTASTDAG
jgi:hypothetical protein